MLRKIKLGGWLGRKFGKEYEMDVASATEAVRALSSQVNGFRHYLEDGEGREQKFKIIVNDNVLYKPEESMNMMSKGDIHIMPVYQGSGNVFNFVLGAVMLGVALFAPFVTGALAWGLGAAGAGLMLGGVAGLLIKPPKMEKQSERKDDRGYLFNGPTNVTQQGQSIPYGYGRLLVGSQVISASITSQDIPV